MSLIKFLFLSTIPLTLLAACGGNTPEVESISDSAAPTEPTLTIDTAILDPTVTNAPAATFTAEPPPAAQATETQLPTASESAEPAAEPAQEDVTIKGSGNLIQHATYYTPGGSEPLPGAILLHMLGSDRQVWQDNGFAEHLAENGYAVLTVDMRGHGATGGSNDWQLAPEDLSRVWDYFTSFESVDSQRTAVIGASIGANLALVTGANVPAIKTVVLLSPGLDYRGVTTKNPIAAYGERPLLIVASEEDTYAADSSRTLSGLAQGESQLQMYNGAGHGTSMFNAQPDLSDLILNWLAQNLN